MSDDQATPDLDVLKAVCCLAAVDAGVTVDELQVLKTVAGGLGLNRAAVDAMLQRAGTDEAYRAERVGIATKDPDGAIGVVARVARETTTVDAGLLAMLLWRVATKLEMTPERFDEILGAE